MSVEGLAELQQRMAALPEAVQHELEANAVNRGAEVIAEAARDNCPEGVDPADQHPGALKGTVKVVPAKADGQRIRARVTAGSKEVIYALMVEVGHFAGDRKLGANRRFVSGHPWFRPAFDENADAAADRIGVAIAAVVNDLWSSGGAA